MNYLILAIAVICLIFLCITIGFGKGRYCSKDQAPPKPPPPPRPPRSNVVIKLDKSQAPDPKTIPPPKPKPKD